MGKVRILLGLVGYLSLGKLVLAQDCPKGVEFYRRDFVRTGSLQSASCFTKLLKTSSNPSSLPKLAPPPKSLLPPPKLTNIAPPPLPGGMTAQTSAPPPNPSETDSKVPTPLTASVSKEVVPAPPNPESPLAPTVSTGSMNVQRVRLGSYGDDEEWLSFEVEGNQVRVMHTTEILNKFWLTRTQYEHPPTKIRACLMSDFNKTKCATAEGRVIILPEGQSLNDVIFDIQFMENGALTQRSLRISPNQTPILFKPELF